jgi:hypothetical protein
LHAFRAFPSGFDDQVDLDMIKVRPQAREGRISALGVPIAEPIAANKKAPNRLWRRLSFHKYSPASFCFRQAVVNMEASQSRPTRIDDLFDFTGMKK